ncbi:hypothetical protein EV401DRAFT_1862589 [Pisolithus croceorrhizus]|nr:hypothetical protein EV401DRAFT_1862589 [Pisolithus croceorrhizus]
MEHWPTDERQRTTLQRGRPRPQDCDFWSWPHLDHGSLGRTTLTTKADGRLQWSFVTDTARRRKVVPIGPPARIFPDSRPPEINVREHSIRKRSEEGLQYLRNYFPDADFPGDLVRHELTAVAEGPAGVGPSDSSTGNLLELLPSHPSSNVYDLLFPMGPLGRELNVLSLSPSPLGGFTFRASGVPSFTFDTPILQLSGSTSSLRSDRLPYNIALARTYTSVSLIKLSTSTDDSHLQVTRDIEFTRADTGDIPIADSRILEAGPHIILANRVGHVFKSDICAAGNATCVISPSWKHRPNLSDVFWQLGVASSRDGCFLTSSTGVKYLDFRTSGTARVVYSLDKPGAVVTCYETPGRDNLSHVTTTSDIIWLDDRFAKKPILSFKHHRSYDRTLKTLTVQLGFGPLVLLTSRKNGLVTVYDVSRGTDGLVHCNSPPSCLPWNKPLNALYAGCTAVASPCMSKMSFLALTHQGGIYQQDIQIITGDEMPAFIEGNRVVRVWDADVDKLDKQASDLHPDVGPVGGRHFTEVNFRGVYDSWYLSLKIGNDGLGEAFRDELAQLPAFWQRVENPLEVILTTWIILPFAESSADYAISRLDLVAYVADKSKAPANFFTSCVTSGKSACQAVARGDISVKELADLTPWNYNLLKTMHRLPYDIPDDLSTFTEHLKMLQLESGGEGAESSLRRQTEAQEQLAMDISLSCDVFSPRPIAMPRSTEAVSERIYEENRHAGVADEPPDIEFSFFRPVLRIGANHYMPPEETSPMLTEEDTKISSPMGVRLLLADWEVGSKVENYNYRDPYNATEVERTSGPRRKQVLRTPAPTQSTVVPSQRPPTIVAATGARSAVRPQWEVIGTEVTHTTKQSYSQETAFYSTFDTSSQDPMPSTQVLPGPYGGRLTAGKKKPTKKRVGGRPYTICDVTGVATICAHENGICGWSSEEDSMDGVRYGDLTFTSKHTTRTPPNPWFDNAAFNNTLRRNKSVVCALSASYISTFAGYPLDSLKSRLQTTKTRISLLKLAGLVYREEGLVGFYRGLWIPLVTISFVRTASFTIYSDTKEYCSRKNYFTGDSMYDAALAGGISGALSGSLISFGSAPFELVKVRRQLEYSIAATKGIQLVKPPNTIEAVRDIVRTHGLSGLYLGFRLHFLRDTSGTALYFFEYDAMRHLLGRQRSGEQGSTPHWLPIPVSLIPFVCGSFAGVTSWALIYPLDVVKTKVQQRALAGTPPRGVRETFYRLIRGPDPNDPKPVLAGIARIYRGLGVSAVRSITTHGLLWTFFDFTSRYIDGLS